MERSLAQSIVRAVFALRQITSNPVLYVRAAADRIYLSQEMGLRKPEAEIYLRVLEEEGFSAADTVFFDDNVDNIAGANRLGITSILVTGKETIPDYFAKQLC